MTRYILLLFTAGMIVSLCAVRLWGSTNFKESAQESDGNFDEALVQFAEREKLNVFCDASDAPAVKARAVSVDGKTWRERLDALTKGNGYIWWAVSSYSFTRQRPDEALLVRQQPSVDEITRLGIEVRRELLAQPSDPQRRYQMETFLSERLTMLLSQLPEERQRQGVLFGEMSNWETVAPAVWYLLWATEQQMPFARMLTEGLSPGTTLRTAVTEQQPFLYVESPAPVPFSFGFNTKWAKEGK